MAMLHEILAEGAKKIYKKSWGECSTWINVGECPTMPFSTEDILANDWIEYFEEKPKEKKKIKLYRYTIFEEAYSRYRQLDWTSEQPMQRVNNALNKIVSTEEKEIEVEE